MNDNVLLGNTKLQKLKGYNESCIGIVNNGMQRELEEFKELANRYHDIGNSVELGENVYYEMQKALWEVEKMIVKSREIYHKVDELIEIQRHIMSGNGGMVE